MSEPSPPASKIRVEAVAMSIDGFVAGRDQSRDHPLGVGGPALFQWFFRTRTWQAMYGQPGQGETGADDDAAARGFENIGAWILGRNMFGPIRGPWPDDRWQGWWGDEPPYHVPVFVLTHHARAPLAMKGGTVFHFVTDGMHAALERAREAADGRDVRLGGGASTIRQFVRARSVDELHLTIAPVLLGRGESLFHGLDLPALGYEWVEHVPGKRAVAHVTLRRRG
jgi:dihydrofolate reductase